MLGHKGIRLNFSLLSLLFSLIIPYSRRNDFVFFSWILHIFIPYLHKYSAFCKEGKSRQHLIFQKWKSIMKCKQFRATNSNFTCRSYFIANYFLKIASIYKKLCSRQGLYLMVQKYSERVMRNYWFRVMYYSNFGGSARIWRQIVIDKKS